MSNLDSIIRRGEPSETWNSSSGNSLAGLDDALSGKTANLDSNVSNWNFMASRRWVSQGSFTLVEIIIVIVILGILAAVAIPKVIAPNEYVRSSEGRQILAALLGAQKSYALENGAYAGSIGSLDITIPGPANFSAPTVANDANALASIVRKESSTTLYTLKIKDSGAIICEAGTVTCAEIKCKGAGNQCN